MRDQDARIDGVIKPSNIWMKNSSLGFNSFLHENMLRKIRVTILVRIARGENESLITVGGRNEKT